MSRNRKQVEDLSFLHLQAELSRIDVLIQRQVIRWRVAGQDHEDAFRGLYVSDGEASALLNRPFAGNWGQSAVIADQAEVRFEEVLKQAESQSQALVEHAESQHVTLRLRQIANIFNLSAFELDTLLICLAPSLDLRYERLYGYLQDDVTRKRPTVNLVIDLLCEPGADRLQFLPQFGPQAPLFFYRLLEKVSGPSVHQPLLSQFLEVDESVVSWLLGHYQPHEELASFVKLIDHPAKDFTVAVEDQLTAILENAHEEPPVLILHGRDYAGQDAAARFVAAQLSQPLMVVNLDRIETFDPRSDAEILSKEQMLRLVLRDARLAGAVPYIRGWDSALNDGVTPAGLLAEVCDFPGVPVISGLSPWRAAGIDRERLLTWLAFDIPGYLERRTIWTHYLEQIGVDAELVDLTALAGQFQLTRGQVRDAVISARDGSRQARKQVDNSALFAAARQYSNPRLASLARKLNPRYGWDDIVLPQDQRNLLHEIVSTVRQRPRVLDEWGVGHKLASSRGVTVLFAGPPGTGKTMAAEVIAGELGLDLFKIDLSTVVSKYIGETEKNLERIFNEAETSNAILFFDEADSLFGKRSEVRDSHDRYANIEISYLLQRMEGYDGVTILATNLRANLDEAFTRRLQFAVDYPFPEEADRMKIWGTLFPSGVPRGPDVDLALLARRYKLAGGNIRNIIVNAAFLAAADGGLVTMEHMLHGTRRELQKMGRLVGDDDLFSR